MQIRCHQNNKNMFAFQSFMQMWLCSPSPPSPGAWLVESWTFTCSLAQIRALWLFNTWMLSVSIHVCEFHCIGYLVKKPIEEHVIRDSFHLTLGKPAMPIYWALGYHLCRWGYKSSNKTWDVVKEMRNYGIPQVPWPLVAFSAQQLLIWDPG